MKAYFPRYICLSTLNLCALNGSPPHSADQFRVDVTTLYCPPITLLKTEKLLQRILGNADQYIYSTT